MLLIEPKQSMRAQAGFCKRRESAQEEQRERLPRRRLFVAALEIVKEDGRTKVELGRSVVQFRARLVRCRNALGGV